MKFNLLSDLLLIGAVILFLAMLVFSFRVLARHPSAEWADVLWADESWKLVIGGFALSMVILAVVSRLRASYHCALGQEFNSDYKNLHTKFDFEEGEYGIQDTLSHVEWGLRLAVAQKDEDAGLVNRLFVGPAASDRVAELRAAALKFFDV